MSQSYYGLLEVLTMDHMDFISTLEPEVFIYILSSISEGLTGLGKCREASDPQTNDNKGRYNDRINRQAIGA